MKILTLLEISRHEVDADEAEAKMKEMTLNWFYENYDSVHSVLEDSEIPEVLFDQLAEQLELEDLFLADNHKDRILKTLQRGQYDRLARKIRQWAFTFDDWYESSEGQDTSNELAADMADDAAYQRDPAAYFGVSRHG